MSAFFKPHRLAAILVECGIDPFGAENYRVPG